MSGIVNAPHCFTCSQPPQIVQRPHSEHRVHPWTLWLQDVGYSDLNAEVAQDYKRIVVLTNWHKQAIHVQNGVPLEKMVVIGNFLLPEHFQERRERDPNHYLYASSPDRGLIGLLRIWPKIREMNPKATLTVG